MTMKNKCAKRSRISDRGRCGGAQARVAVLAHADDASEILQAHVAEQLRPTIEFATDRKLGVGRIP